jgi:hypothetical protein
MAAPQASLFTTKSTKDTKEPSTSPFAFFVSFVVKDSACGAHLWSDQPPFIQSCLSPGVRLAFAGKRVVGDGQNESAEAGLGWRRS